MENEKEIITPKKEQMSETAKNILFFLVMGLIISLIFTGKFIYRHGNPIRFNEARANDGDTIQVYINYSAHSDWDYTYGLRYWVILDDSGEQTYFSCSTDSLHSDTDRRRGKCLLSSDIYYEILQMVNEENLAQDRTSNSDNGYPLDPDGLNYPVLIVVSSASGYSFYYADSSAIADRCEELEQFVDFDQ